MGARLQYAKVIDRERFYARGGRIHPKLESGVVLDSEPGRAGAFLVLRGWTDDHGSFTEQWMIEAPGGLDVAADDYNVVFYLDEREVARATFPVMSQMRETIE